MSAQPSHSCAELPFQPANSIRLVLDEAVPDWSSTAQRSARPNMGSVSPQASPSPASGSHIPKPSSPTPHMRGSPSPGKSMLPIPASHTGSGTRLIPSPQRRSSDSNLGTRVLSVYVPLISVAPVSAAAVSSKLDGTNHHTSATPAYNASAYQDLVCGLNGAHRHALTHNRRRTISTRASRTRTILITRSPHRPTSRRQSKHLLIPPAM
jgi:hypothetical protein